MKSQSPAHPSRFSRSTSRRYLLLLLFCGLLVYANTLRHPFVHDDVVFIQNNPRIQDLSDIGQIFREGGGFPSRDSGIINPYYRPLLEIVYRGEYRLFRLRPLGYHLVNILLHVLNAVLLFFISRRLTGGRTAMAGGIALLFLLHPIQTETVACVSGVSNLVFTLFCLSAFLLYLKIVTASGARAVVSLVLSVLSWGLYVMGLLAKEQAIVLPILLLFYEWTTPRPSGQRENLKKILLAGFVLLTAGYLTWRKIVLGAYAVALFQYPYELFMRVTAIPTTLMMHLGTLLFPSDLHYYRSVDVLAARGPAAIGLVAVIVILGVLLQALRRAGAKEALALARFGAGWFVVTLLPTLNILPLVNEYSFIAAFEHFLYLPLAGLLFLGFAAVDFGLARYAGAKKTTLAVVLVGILALIYGALTIRQNTYWRGEVPLFERVIRFEPRLARVRVLLGKAYYFDRRYDKAVQEYETALAILNGYIEKAAASPARDFYLGVTRDIHFDLAHCYEAKGDLPAAIRQYEAALRIAPEDSAIYNSLGADYLRMGDVDRAIGYFREAVAKDDLNLMAKSNLAVCYIEKGDKAAAERLLREVLAVDAGFLPARQNLERLSQGSPK